MCFSRARRVVSGCVAAIVVAASAVLVEGSAAAEPMPTPAPAAPAVSPGRATAGVDASADGVVVKRISARKISANSTQQTNSVAAAQDVISCEINVQNPHDSHHVDGTVNIVVTEKCTGPVTYISIRAALFQNQSQVKDSGSKTFYGVAKAQNNAAVPCRTATYQGFGSDFVQFPPGYEPPTVSDALYGSSVLIQC